MRICDSRSEVLYVGDQIVSSETPQGPRFTIVVCAHDADIVIFDVGNDMRSRKEFLDQIFNEPRLVRMNRSMMRASKWIKVKDQ